MDFEGKVDFLFSLTNKSCHPLLIFIINILNMPSCTLLLKCFLAKLFPITSFTLDWIQLSGNQHESYLYNGTPPSSFPKSSWEGWEKPPKRAQGNEMGDRFIWQPEMLVLMA